MAISSTRAPSCACKALHRRQQGREQGCGRARRTPPRFRAAAGLTPHSGYHWDGSPRRFFEGWYFKVTLPGEGASFALIYSIEDPAGGSPTQGVGAQIMGPSDSYLLQYSRDISKFWADNDSLALGTCFQGTPPIPRGPLPQEEFDRRVQQGFQATQTWHQGSLVAAECDANGNLPSTVRTARWAFSVAPRLGWGAPLARQQSTAGWLASLPVFEPHWQVMMALGEATGWLEWDGRRYEFEGASAYAEKNWGGGFPSKWFWVQCDAFPLGPAGERFALTSVGARRQTLTAGGREEEVGLIGLHWGERFIELVPWKAELEWEVEPWGHWEVRGRDEEFDVLVEATCDRPGTALRAPTAAKGLSPICRDTFYGKVRVRVWAAGPRSELLLDVESGSAALETGGAPWWSAWRATARMTEPLRTLLNLPVDVEALSSRLPQPLRPRGL